MSDLLRENIYRLRRLYRQKLSGVWSCKDPKCLISGHGLRREDCVLCLVVEQKSWLHKRGVSYTAMDFLEEGVGGPRRGRRCSGGRGAHPSGPAGRWPNLAKASRSRRPGKY